MEQVISIYTCWFSKSNKPKDDFSITNGTKIHYCKGVNPKKTLCGFIIKGSRWSIDIKKQNKMEVNCEYCLKTHKE